MEAFGGDSPLSEAPTSASGSPPKPDIKSKAPSPLKTKKQANVASSRRSSRIEDRSQSPDKPVVSRIGTTGLKFKLARHPSPEKPDNADKVDKEMGDEKRGKKRKSEPKAGNEGVVEEAREAMGQKKAKITHETQSEVKEEEEGPKKKNVAVKKKKGKSEKSSNDLLADLFSDGEDDEAFRGNEKEEEIVAKPMIKIKQGKAKGKAKVEKVEGDGDGDVVMGEPQPESPLPATTSIGKKSSKARRGEEEEFKPEGGPPEATEPSSFTTKSKSKSGRLIKKAPSDDFIEEPSVPKAKGKKKNGQSKDTSVSSQPNPSETTQKGTPDTIPAPEDKATTSTTDPAAAPSKPKKSYAQTVVGSPVPSSDALPTKKVTKSIPATTKFTNTQQSGPSSSVSTPDKKSMSTPTGSTIKKVTPAPVQVKKPQPVKEVSLLESTMASLLGGHTGLNSTTKSTPKKEESKKETPKPKHVQKDRPKGQWSDTWEMNPSQQREFMESREEREADRRRRMEYRKNPVNLQEAKDSYRLDSTKPRVIPALPIPFGGLGVKTEGAPSKMIQALVDRNRENARLAQQSQTQTI